MFEILPMAQDDEAGFQLADLMLTQRLKNSLV